MPSLPSPMPSTHVDARPPRGVGFWLLTTGVFTLLFVLRFAYVYLDDLTRGSTGTLGMRLMEESTGSGTALLLFIAVLVVERRWPMNRAHWRRSLPVHLATFVAFTVAHTTLMAASRAFLAPLLGLGQYDYGRMTVRYFMEAPNDAIGYAVALVALALPTIPFGQAMRILLVDDEAPARARLRRLLTDEPDVDVVGEAGTGLIAVEAIAELQPDLVLLDVQMPGTASEWWPIPPTRPGTDRGRIARAPPMPGR